VHDLSRHSVGFLLIRITGLADAEIGLQTVGPEQRGHSVIAKLRLQLQNGVLGRTG
jgi:hypothetical protein